MAKKGIKVNLLKNRRVLSERDYLRELKFYQITVVGLILVLVVTVAMAIWNYFLSNKLSTIEETITSANTQLQGLSQANAEQLYVKSRLTLIGNFLKDQSIARESLQQVLALSAPGISIGAISYEKQNEIIVTVVADNHASLEQVLEYYQQADGYFPQVVAEAVTANKDGGYEMRMILSLPVKESKI